MENMVLTNIKTYKKDGKNVYRKDTYKGKGRPKDDDYMKLKAQVIGSDENTVKRILYELE